MTNRMIALIQPPTGAYRRDDRCQSHVDDQTIRVSFPPMDLAYHAAVLEQAGYSCCIRDYSTAGQSIPEALEDLKNIHPWVVFFSSTQPTEANDLAFAKLLKKENPDIFIILRGESVTHRDEFLVRNHPQIDYILRGESEETLKELVQILSDNCLHLLDNIQGISYLHNNTFIRTPDRPFIKDLNSLPWPARHLLDQELYRSPETGNVLTTLYTARGCPYPCIFCPAPLASGRPVRLRSVDDLIAEIHACVNNYDISEFLFHGDTFTYSKKWVLELCQKIDEHGLKIRWGCNSRVDTIDHDMLRVMKKAGCWVIGFGVESGHEETLKKIRKAVKREDILNAFQMCREVGIRSHAFFVFGFPWEGKEHLDANLELAKEIDPDFFDFNIAYPLPGTELLEMVENKGIFKVTETNQGGYAIPALHTDFLSAEELEAWRRKALLSLYLRPRYIIRTLWLARSPRKIWNYLKAGTFRLLQLAKGNLRRNTENPLSSYSPEKALTSK